MGARAGFCPDFNFMGSPTLWEFFADNESFVRCIPGPVGSGKSTACCAEIMRIAMAQDVDPSTKTRRSRFLIVRNTRPDLKSTTIQTWLEWFPEESCGPLVYSSPITHRIKTGELDIEIYFLPLDKPVDVRKIRSLEVTAAWVNEASEVPKAIIDMIRRRVGRFPRRQGKFEAKRACLILDYNAPDEDHWLAGFHLREKPAGWAFFRQPPAVLETDCDGLCIEADPRYKGLQFDKPIHWRGHYWVVNPQAENLNNLRKTYYQDSIAGSSIDQIRRDLQAKYVYVQNGKPVIPDYNDELYASATLNVLQGIPLTLGLDIGGGTLHPAAVIAQRHPRGTWLILAEIVAAGMGINRFVAQIAETCNTLFPNMKIGEVWGDPAGAKRDELYEMAIFDHLRKRGLNAQPVESNDPSLRIEAIVRPLSRLIDGRPGILIHHRCTTLRKALSGAWHYKRIQAAGDERFVEKPNKNHPYSDIGDALGYLLMGGGETQALRQGQEGGFTQLMAPFTAKTEFDVFST